MNVHAITSWSSDIGKGSIGRKYYDHDCKGDVVVISILRTAARRASKYANLAAEGGLAGRERTERRALAEPAYFRLSMEEP